MPGEGCRQFSPQVNFTGIQDIRKLPQASNLGQEAAGYANRERGVFELLEWDLEALVAGPEPADSPQAATQHGRHQRPCEQPTRFHDVPLLGWAGDRRRQAEADHGSRDAAPIGKELQEFRADAACLPPFRLYQTTRSI
jgi:hypothetical protein